MTSRRRPMSTITAEMASVPTASAEAAVVDPRTTTAMIDCPTSATMTNRSEIAVDAVTRVEVGRADVRAAGATRTRAPSIAPPLARSDVAQEPVPRGHDHRPVHLLGG